MNNITLDIHAVDGDHPIALRDFGTFTCLGLHGGAVTLYFENPERLAEWANDLALEAVLMSQES